MVNEEKKSLDAINQAHLGLVKAIKDSRSNVNLPVGTSNRNLLEKSSIIDGPITKIDKKNIKKFTNTKLFLNRQDLTRHCKFQLSDKLNTLEIGSQTGIYSSFIYKIFNPIKHYVIDIRFSAFKKEFVSDRMIFFEGTSEMMIPKIPDNSVDFIYIDGGHSYDVIKKDIELSLTKLKQNGIIQFNDYCSYSPLEQIPYGVKSAVNELINKLDLEVIGMTLTPLGYDDIAVKFV